MLDDIREWISDNLRYILLGVAGILVILIIVLAVRLIGDGHKTEKSKKEQKVAETEQEPQSENKTATPPASTTASLERNQADVLDLVTSYYTARLNQDYDTLAEICGELDDNAKAAYEAQDEAFESYNNLMTYSKPGLTEGSYVVFAYFDSKLTGIDTLIPTLRGLYLVTNEDGKLVVSEPESHPDQRAYLQQVWADEDVQALRKDVADRYNESIAQDPDLAAYVASIESEADGTGASVEDDAESTGEENGDAAGNESDGDNSDAQLGTMYASTGVNVRAEPSAESTKYGSLDFGMQVEVLENLDNGWSRVSFYTSEGTPKEGYVMTQYLTSGQ